MPSQPARLTSSRRVGIGSLVAMLVLLAAWLPADAASPDPHTLTCGSGFPYSASANAGISPGAFASTDNTYSACYYLYLNGSALISGGIQDINYGQWYPNWPPGVLWVPVDSPVYDMQGTHNVCQTSSYTICNPVWVYSHAY